MSDSLGSITVPSVSPSGTFPLTVNYGVVTIIAPETVTHTFGAGNSKREQRFFLGNGARQWQLNQDVTDSERNAVRDFWELREGSYQPFTFHAPNADGTTTDYSVQFANVPLTWDYSNGGISRIQVQLIEVNTGSGPTYSVASTVLRFPSTTLATALTAQAQTLIPLLHIKPKKSGYPDNIYLSDRRCTVGGQLYQARLLRWENIGQVAVGVPNTSGQSDDVTFVLGNADRVMRQLAYDVNLNLADVEFSIFHVDSGILLQFWKGIITPGGWSSSASTTEFTLKCSDPLSSPFLTFPRRIIDRKCDKLYDDGVECPYSSVGALDTTHFPAADASFCDRGYDTPNGCLAHGMQRYYGGIIAVPQSVRVSDNSTGHFGIGRSIITPTSLIADSVYGQPIPVVVTDIDFKQKAKIIAGRDEGDFYEAFAVVCEGPVVFGSGHTLDGQYQHGYPGPLGLRLIPGSDPAGATDWISLDQSGNQAGGDFRLVFSGNSTYLNNYSAGVAAIAIRIKDEKGIQLTTLDQHDVEAIISQGWQGWRWTGSGSRALGSMTNPVWLTINAYLAGTRFWLDSASTQEEKFDLDAALVWGPVCDATVTRLVEAGTETQFKAIGVMQDQRPLRDYLADILANCLGYYAFSFGRLRIGIRENASVVSAYTTGNMIWKSLKVSPAGPQFTRLTGTFADREHNWVANTATYQDDDYALELGEGVRVIHRSANVNLSLTADISQAQRLVTIRGREEMGGVNEAERNAAVNAMWSTTVIGLDTDPGAVVSITDPEMPGGSGKVRVSRLVLRSDWGIDIEARTVTDSMYDLVTGPKPADVRPGPIPPEVFPVPLGPVWFPNTEAPASGDPLYAPDDKSFSLAQRYIEGTDGVTQVVLTVTGNFPVNSLLADTVPPQIRSSSQTTTGGHLAPGKYWFAVILRDADGNFGQPSNIIQLYFPAGTTNKAVFSDITWPAGTWAGYTVLASHEDGRRICEQIEVSGTLPSSITIDYPLARSTYGLPSPLPKKVRVRAKEVIHAGNDGARITFVGAGKVRCAELAGLADDWSNRAGSVISDQSDGEAPIWNFFISAYDYTTAEFTCSPDPAAAGVEAGDVLIIDYVANVATANSVGDGKFITGRYPTGMVIDEERGRMVRFDTGTARGQTRLISSNTHTVVFWDDPLDPAPQVGDKFSIEESGWTNPTDGSELTAANTDTRTVINLPIGNRQNRVMRVAGILVDRFGNEAPESLSPIRDVWVDGGLSNVILSEVTVTSDYTAGPGDRVVTADVSGGSITVTMAPSALIVGKATVFECAKGSSGNTATIVGQGSDTVDGASSKVLAEGESVMVIF